MKRIPLLLFILLSIISTQAQVNAESIVNDFLIPSAGGIFRGFDFGTLEDELDEMEKSRPFVEYAFEEVDEDLNLTIGYDLYFKDSDDNFAYIDYNVDLIGIYEVIAYVYLESDKAAYDVFNQFNKYYTNKLGVGTLESDGWTRFGGTYLEDPYDVWIYLDEDEEGKFVRYELVYMGE